MPDPLREHLSKITGRFEALGAKIVVSPGDFGVVQMYAAKVIRRLQKSLCIIVSTYDKVEQALEKDAYWLDTVVLEALPRDRCELVPIVLSPPGSKTVALRLKGQLLVQEQPIIPLDSLLSGRDPAEALRQALVSYADYRLLSPYRIDTATPREMLFGRERLISDIIHSKTSWALVGPRRIGKTSIAKEVQRRLGVIDRPFAGFRKEKEDDPTGPMNRCSHIDVSELGSQASTLIWGQILRKFNLARRDFSAGGRLAKLVGGKHLERREFIVDEAKALSALVGKFESQLTIILDEVDSLLEREAEKCWPTMEQLRGIVEDGRARVILVGYETLAIAKEDHRFPLGARTKKLSVGPLERKWMDELVTQPLKELAITLDSQEQMLNWIWNTTSGMPHAVQEICHHLVEASLSAGGKSRRPRVTFADLKAAIKQSEAVKTLRRGVLRADFPLAEAIAGISATTGSDIAETEPDSERDLSTVDSRPVTIITSDELARHLEEAGYQYDSREFDLALTYLEIRFTIIPNDDARTQWTWRNQIARRTMASAINGIGATRWLRDVMARHTEGVWRKRYKTLGKL